MNHFDTVKFGLLRRLYPYSNGRKAKDLEDMITHFMRYQEHALKKRKKRDLYFFTSTDIEMIYNHILSDILPR